MNISSIRLAVLGGIVFLLAPTPVRAQTFQLIDPFETHNWHAIGFSNDTGSGAYSSAWKTQGETSYKMTVTHQGQGSFIFGTGVFDIEAPDFIKFDAKAGSNMDLEIKVVNENNVESLLGVVRLTAGQVKVDNIIQFNGKTMRKMYLVPANYAVGTHNVYIDNMRISVSGVESLWDGFEEHFYWDGSADADNPDFLTDRADDITHTVFSPNFGSTASLIMEWDAAVDPSADFAQIQVQNVDLDYSDFYYFRFDVLRPSTTPNAFLYISLSAVSNGDTTRAGTNFIKVDTPDQWTTVTLLVGETLDLQHLNELKFVVPFTDSLQYATGRFYFDNLRVGGFTPEDTLVDLSTLGFPHVVKDFSDGLDGNNFFGISTIGAGNGASIARTISSDTAFTNPAMRLDYDVGADSASFVFYVNTLGLNSAKKKLALYLTAGPANPRRVKLEFHDSNWFSSGFTEGSAFGVLSGLSSAVWKQWIVPVDPNSLTVLGSFDPTDIREVVLSLDYLTADDPAKAGAFYVDDVTFVDETDELAPFPGLHFPLSSPQEVRNIGVPYLLDDFDGRVLDADGSVRNMGFNEFSGLTSVRFNPTSGDTLAAGSISSTETGGTAHTTPYAYKIDYTFHPDSTDEFVFYLNKLAPLGSPDSIRDFSFLEKFSIWVKGEAGGNPGAVVLEFHDDTWQSSNFTTGKAHTVLAGVEANAWKQWVIPLNNDSLAITGDFDSSRLAEVVISFDVAQVDDKVGTLYLDDLQFVDTDSAYVTTGDFQSDEFLNLVERRTFQYFLDAVDPITGLVLDRVHFRGLATTAGTGFGLTAMCIGAERGWISHTDAEDYVAKVLAHLLSSPQGLASTGTSGYNGFFYHFLEASTGLRKDDNVELSVVDTALLMAGVLTARECFAANADIVRDADSLYHRVDWPWFLDTTGTQNSNPNYNQFYLGWSPENGFVGHWDYSTDEVMLINLLAIGSSTHPVPPDVFYAWQRVLGTYNGHTLIQSFNGSMFQYFFANCWYDLHNKRDSLGVDWWTNSVEAGRANRDFAIAGMDGLGRVYVPTYHANSWGLSAMENIPAGLDTLYFGGNGAPPKGSGNNSEVDGTVPVYGGLSMIGFSAHPEGIPVVYITDMMQHYYQNTQLWTGWYGFRDAYTDSMSVKPGAISRFPIYKSAYFAIDQGPMLIMLENFRSGLIWETYNANASVMQAISIVTDVSTDVSADPEAGLPLQYELYPAYPNPFNPVTTIPFALPSSAEVTIKVYNVLGQEVATLLKEQLPPGRHRVTWNAHGLPSGVYFYRLQTEVFTSTQSVLLIK